jgi:hypothetical protein
MRTIAGALLIVAASVCLGAGIVGAAIWQNRSGFDPSGLGYLAAFVLGPFGLILLLAGLATDSTARADGGPTPRWVWLALLVCMLTVFGVIAMSLITWFEAKAKG